MGLKPGTVASSSGKGHCGGGEMFLGFALLLDDDGCCSSALLREEYCDTS
jgi:hypothetical protein